MFSFLLESSVALIGAGLFSAILMVTRHRRRRRRKVVSVSLSEPPGNVGEQDNEQELLSGGQDPFDIIEPEDVSDGEPVNGREFWRKINLSKVGLLAIISMLLIDHSVSIGYTLIAQPSSPILSILPSIHHLIFTVYLIGVTVLSLGVSTADDHWPAIVHIASLATLSTIAQGISIFVPIGNSPSSCHHTNDQIYRTVERDSDIAYLFWYASLVLTAVTTTIATTMPLGPQLYFPPSRVYTDKIIEAEKARGDDTDVSVGDSLNSPANVSGLVGSSCIGFILFDYTTGVVMLGYTSISLEIADLPILPASLRATHIFYNMKRLLRFHGIKDQSDARTSTSRWGTYGFTIGIPFAVPLTRIFPAIETIFPSITYRWNIKPFSVFAMRKNPPLWIKLLLQLAKSNINILITEMLLAISSAILVYIPIVFLKRLIMWLENDPMRAGGKPTNGVLAWLTMPNTESYSPSLEKQSRRWAWVYCAGIFGTTLLHYLVTAQMFSVSATVVQLRLKTQLNTTLFAKTLVRKSVSSVSGEDKDEGKQEIAKVDNKNVQHPDSAVQSTETEAVPTSETRPESDLVHEAEDNAKSLKEGFSSKTQVMTLMTTDVDRVASLSSRICMMVIFPMEILIGGYILWTLLGISAFVGLSASLFVMPVSHWATKIVSKTQDDLMHARDERITLINEVLGAVRMLKFNAWERMFQKRIAKVRDRELSYQWRTFATETLLNTTWRLSPILVTIAGFWHYAVFRGLPLTPSIAFTSLTVFSELRFALGFLPEIFINVVQSIVSLRRISRYLDMQEVSSVPLHEQSTSITLNSATIGWGQEYVTTEFTTPAPLGSSGISRRNFVLTDLTLDIPHGGLSLICGRIGSGKTLLLLALLGEADVLSGQVVCPRSPPGAIANTMRISEGDWVRSGMCAYVPQVAWLQNASIKENILFNLPFDATRYQQTLEACALVPDLTILEDGDESEIGERGVNLSGGQKARVSLARAVYSRASTLLLDDILSAVDAHTAQHLYENCICGPLLKGRTVILVSHHIQLCAPQAKYVVTLERGKLIYQGSSRDFLSSPTMGTLTQSEHSNLDAGTEEIIETLDVILDTIDESKEIKLPPTKRSGVEEVNGAQKSRVPKKLVEDEARVVGRIGKDVWATYLNSTGGQVYWAVLIVALVLASLDPVAENGWIKVWSGAVNRGDTGRTPLSYITIYVLIAIAGLIVFTLQFFVLYRGSIHASHILHKELVKAVLFAPLRFHDTTNRGRLLNRFGKDFEGIDSSLSDNFGRSLMGLCGVVATISIVTFVGGWQFLLAFLVLGLFYFEGTGIYARTARDMRRLESVSSSPLYSIYGETVTGVAVIRAFGASSKFMRDMLRCVDTNLSCFYWTWGVNNWIGVHFNILSTIIIGITASIVVLNTDIDASYAGLAMTFVTGITQDMLSLVQRVITLDQSMVAVERVKELSQITQEPPEFIEPRPPASWPSSGSIEVDHLSIRYAPDLPNVLHDLNFTINSGQKVGLLGRTGGGKSTLALSFFRFVESFEGKILIDGLDISKIGLTDLRSHLTIIPQDPTILSGTLRSTLDIFEEYEDAEIYEVLHRVHLIPSIDDIVAPGDVNTNVFQNLDSPVSEGGENFSAGEKQLICMARAILKRTKILFMDEATASVDYAMDELIGRTIRQEFKESTIFTIAHRIRTVIDYDVVMVIDKGRIIEFARPSTPLADINSQFYSLCKASGPEEFSVLRKLSNTSKPL